MKRLAIAAAALLWTGAVLAQDAPKGSAERGKKLFVDLNCYSCHGTQGQGGGRNAEPPIPLGYPFAGFVNQMRKPRLDMPAYEEKLVSTQEIADLYAYFSSIKAAPAAKDIPLLKGL
jgi:mono/diheme cytochrome c family protein